MALLAEAAVIGPDSTLTIGIAIAGGAGLLGLGSWSAILRHTQDDLKRSVERLKEQVAELQAERAAREAIETFKEKQAQRKERRRTRPDSDAPRKRPADSSY